MLVKMLDAGMNVARLDFSNYDHKTHQQSLENL
jgi:pyruvate kinase